MAYFTLLYFTNNFPGSGRGLGHVTPTIFGSAVGYPSDSLASCLYFLQFPSVCFYYYNYLSFYISKVISSYTFTYHAVVPIGGRIKCCTLSARLSVRPVPAPSVRIREGRTWLFRSPVWLLGLSCRVT